VPTITFVTLVGSVERTIRLARSVRDFAGPLSGAPVLALHPDDAPLDRGDRGSLEAAGARLGSFPRGDLPALPFAVKAAAAAHAEATVDSDVLAWLDDDTLIVAPPTVLVLAEGIALAYRPVHHRNIGVPGEAPIDEFWTRVFRVCAVPEGRDRTVVTHSGEEIHAYLNAGCFAVDRRRGLMQTWRAQLAALPDDPVLAAWCSRSVPHAIFAHQAVFTGVMLAALEPGEMLEAGPDLNYPLHLHHEVPPERRPASLGDLVTVRYEDLLDGPKPEAPLLDPLSDWLAAMG
jgi:hypothetical protein